MQSLLQRAVMLLLLMVARISVIAKVISHKYYRR